MFSNRKILVVEAEFLIALDIQRTLEGAQASEMAFARHAEEAASLIVNHDAFDLAIVELNTNVPASLDLARDLSAAGVAVVALSSLRGKHPPPVGAFPIPIVHKPFTDDELLAACITALAGPDISTPSP
jgi:DNA-binding response OmpR family regulator